jgi:hypothetical protein
MSTFGLRGTEVASDVEPRRIANQQADPGGTASMRNWLSLSVSDWGEESAQSPFHFLLEVFEPAIRVRRRTPFGVHARNGDKHKSMVSLLIMLPPAADLCHKPAARQPRLLSYAAVR